MPLRLKVGRFGADPSGQTQAEWEASETKKKLWIGGIATAIIAFLALK